MSKLDDSTENQTVPKLILYILYGAGTLGLILSILALIGWQTHMYILVQVSPNHLPIQYNTAVALFFLSLGLLTVLKSPRLTILQRGTAAK